mgnify:CR=1 FL=1
MLLFTGHCFKALFCVLIVGNKSRGECEKGFYLPLYSIALRKHFFEFTPRPFQMMNSGKFNVQVMPSSGILHYVIFVIFYIKPDPKHNPVHS